MEPIKILDKLAVTLFYLADTILIIMMLLSISSSYTLNSSFITLLLYTILICVVYLIIRSIKVKIDEEDD